MQKPGIPAQQMQRTGTRERACGSGTALQHAPQHALQPRSIAWGGGGEAAMKATRTLLLRESLWTRSRRHTVERLSALLPSTVETLPFRSTVEALAVLT